MITITATSTAPGRIVLFGEHSDYLGLPVISLAVNLRIIIKGQFNSGRRYKIIMPNIRRKDSISAKNNGKLRYKKKRDYLRSVINVLSRQYNLPPRGMDVIIDGNIPISGGLSSSSALVVAWTNFILNMHDKSPTKEELADLAFKAEVTEFREPGGIQDHLSTVYGNLNLFDFYPKRQRRKIKIPSNLPVILTGFMERKDTLGTLGRIRWKIFDGMKKIEGVNKQNIYEKLQQMSLSELKDNKANLRKQEYLICKGTIKNREITKKGHNLLTADNAVDWEKVGNLMVEQHKILSNNLQVSTSSIDKAVKRSMEAGAYGAKINGSGGGGSFICLCPPDKVTQIQDAIKKLGGRFYEVQPSDGARYFED